MSDQAFLSEKFLNQHVTTDLNFYEIISVSKFILKICFHYFFLFPSHAETHISVLQGLFWSNIILILKCVIAQNFIQFYIIGFAGGGLFVC
jgi:hypothetical protein